MRGILFRNDGLVFVNWPANTERWIKQIDKGVFGIWRPVRVDQVGVGNVVVQRLLAIGNAFWYETCRARIDFVRENCAEAVAFAQITPRTKYAAVGGGDELIPWLGV